METILNRNICTIAPIYLKMGKKKTSGLLVSVIIARIIIIFVALGLKINTLLEAY